MSSPCTIALWFRSVFLCFLIGWHQGSRTARAQKPDTYEILSRMQEDNSFVAVVRQQGVLFLLYDETIIGAEFDDPWMRQQAAFPGFAIMQASRYLNRDLRHAMQIGLGIGTVPSFLRREGISTDVVELSEAVVTQAANHFQYDWCQPESKQSTCQHGTTFIMDGLSFIQGDIDGMDHAASSLNEESRVKPSKAYDLIIVDVYTGWNPLVFFAKNVIQDVKSKWLLPSKGVLVMNFVGYHNGPHAAVPRSIQKTLQSVFQHVKVFREVPDATDEDACNLIFFASDEPFHFELPHEGHYAHPDPGTYFHIITHFPEWTIFEDDVDDSRIRVLTQENDGQHDFGAAHEATELHMRERVIEQFPRSLWATLETPTNPSLLDKDEL